MSAADPAAALREALAGRENHAAWCGLQARPVWKGRMQFSWSDSFACEQGVLVIVPEAATEATASLLLRELNEWRKRAEREGSGRALDCAPSQRALAGKAG